MKLVILIFLLGLFLGMFINELLRIIFISGTFLIDRSNPQKDICRLEVIDIDAISKKKYVTIKIQTDANLSRN